MGTGGRQADRVPREATGNASSVGDHPIVRGPAALPAAGNLAVALLSEAISVSGRMFSLALHLPSGIVLAVVGLELMPEVLAGSSAGVPIPAFLGAVAGEVGCIEATVRVALSPQ